MECLSRYGQPATGKVNPLCCVCPWPGQTNRPRPAQSEHIGYVPPVVDVVTRRQYTRNNSYASAFSRAVFRFLLIAFLSPPPLPRVWVVIATRGFSYRTGMYVCPPGDSFLECVFTTCLSFEPARAAPGASPGGEPLSPAPVVLDRNSQRAGMFAPPAGRFSLLAACVSTMCLSVQSRPRQAGCKYGKVSRRRTAFPSPGRVLLGSTRLSRAGGTWSLLWNFRRWLS